MGTVKGTPSNLPRVGNVSFSTNYTNTCSRALMQRQPMPPKGDLETSTLSQLTPRKNHLINRFRPSQSLNQNQLPTKGLYMSWNRLPALCHPERLPRRHFSVLE